MSFTIFYVLLLVSTLQVGAVDDINDCLKNSKNAKASYDSQVKAARNNMIQQVSRSVKSIQKLLDEMETNAKCKNQYYSYVDGLSFMPGLLARVGHTSFGRDFDSPWKSNPNLSDEDACDFLMIRGRINLVIIDKDYQLVSSGVQGFGKFYYQPWQQCSNSTMCTEGQ